MNKKAVVLFSGGLDSILAARLMLEQGIEVVCANYYIEFASCGARDSEGAAEKAARALKVPLKVFDITEEYIEILKNPKHGYGANVNPCIDCKIFMIKKAKEYMSEIGASFLVTGEVLGERPMSQRKDALNLIEKRADVKRILLRPLSAKLLDPTAPEIEGIVDREKLLDISGRSRRPQIELAEKFGIKEYPTPAGGCLLTDPGFGKRVKDLIAHDGLSVEGLTLLKVGRHFRLSKDAKLVVGRDKRENEALEKIAKDGDVYLKMKDKPGPLALLRGIIDDETAKIAAGIVAYHTKFKTEGSLRVNCWGDGRLEGRTISVHPATEDEVVKTRI